MIIFIDILAWIGVIFLTVQSLPQIVTLLRRKDFSVAPKSHYPYYFFLVSATTGVLYGLLLQDKILYITMANIIGFTLSGLTIFLFKYRAKCKTLNIFVTIFLIWSAAIIVIVSVFYSLNIYNQEIPYISVPLVVLTIGLNNLAFMPSIIKVIKSKKMHTISIFVLLNGLGLNVSWFFSWFLGYLYHPQIQSAPAYLVIIIIVSQGIGVLMLSTEIAIWFNQSFKHKKEALKQNA